MNSRYQAQAPLLTKQDQLRLQHARILCVGAGGLGASALWYLAAVGIGYLDICDGDNVENTNLNRQILYTPADVGQPKAYCAQQRLQAFNPEITINAYASNLTAENCANLLQHYDLVLDCTDNHATKLLINDDCYQQRRPLISASVYQQSAYCCVLRGPTTSCLRCLFDNQLQSNASCQQAGVLGVVPGMIGVFQAWAAIQYLLGNEGILGRLYAWSSIGEPARILKLSVSSSCPNCTCTVSFVSLALSQQAKPVTHMLDTISVQELKDKLTQQEALYLLDVRQLDEYNSFNLGGTLIPLDQLEARLHEIPRDKPIVAYCHSGYRSMLATEWLKAQGYLVANLSGGVVAWQHAFG